MGSFVSVMQKANLICRTLEKTGSCSGCPFYNRECSMMDFGDSSHVTTDYLNNIQSDIDNWITANRDLL